MESSIESLKGCKSFAILGGTFDPIHYGHIMAGEAIIRQTRVEKILFIPSGNPPHKQKNAVTDGADRGEMIRLAIEGHKDFLYSSMEIDRSGKTYTIDTIREIKKRLGNDKKFYFVTGADAILLIKTWKRYEELLEGCSFIAVTRPGYNKNDFESFVKKLKNDHNCDISLIEIPSVDISSSEIREKINHGLSISGLVPENVEKYIKEKRLYE